MGILTVFTDLAGKSVRSVRIPTDLADLTDIDGKLAKTVRLPADLATHSYKSVRSGSM